MSEKCHKVQLALLEGGLKPGQLRHLAECPKCEEYRRTLGLAMSLPPAEGDRPPPALAPIRARFQRRSRRRLWTHLSFGAGWLAAAAAFAVAVGVGLHWQNRLPANGSAVTAAEAARIDELLADEHIDLIEFSWDDSAAMQRLAELQPAVYDVQWSVTAFDPISEEDLL